MKPSRTLVVMLGVIFGAILTFVILMLAGFIFPYGSTEFGNWAMWVGAIWGGVAAVGAILNIHILTKQHQSTLKLQEEKEYSEHALDSYLQACDSLSAYLKAIDKPHELNFSQFESTLDNLLISSEHMLYQPHKLRASASYERLRTDLKAFCEFISFSHIFNIQLPEGKYSYNLEPSSCAEHLLEHWKNFHLPRDQFYKSVSRATYGFNTNATEVECLSLMSLLTSSPMSLASVKSLQEDYSELRQHYKVACKHHFEVAIHRAPMLFAHLVMYGQVKVEQLSSDNLNLNLNFEATVIPIYDANVWLVLDTNYGKISISPPNPKGGNRSYSIIKPS